jgi:hypothetical protein
MRFSLFFVFKIPPIDCTNKFERGKQDCFTATYLLCYFPRNCSKSVGNHVLDNISRGKVCFICTIQEDGMGFGCLGLVGFVLMDAFVFGNCAVRETSS